MNALRELWTIELARLHWTMNHWGIVLLWIGFWVAFAVSFFAWELWRDSRK